jgi:hypothetical protein
VPGDAIWVKNPKGRDHMDGLVIDERVLLKEILNE